MLEPGSRTVFTELLRPPHGFVLDRLIATTYTLDLVTLVTLPLSFTLASRDGVDDAGRVDPIALLEALRRHARRVTVFCQGGRIAVPKRGQLLFGYLEDSVVEATAPKGGSFHPKVTLVRYLPDGSRREDEDAPAPGAVLYRLLCGTRNLTFDRCWDTVLVLDGELQAGRTNAIARNRPLSEFVAALPRLARPPASEEAARLAAERAAGIAAIAEELLRVRFEPPEGFGDELEDLAFWPIGVGEREVWPFAGRMDSLLVVSPFVDETCLGWLADEADVRTLVSRPERLDRIPAAALPAGECFVLADGLDGEAVAAEEIPAAAPPEPAAAAPAAAEPPSADGDDRVSVEGAGSELRGLHAKLFVADAGWDARLWTGSANATGAAFTRNVEFLVELRGKKSAVGIDAVLGTANGDARSLTDRRVRFRDMLVPYPLAEQAKAPDSIEERLESLLMKARQAFVAARLVGRVTERAGEKAAQYELAVEATAEGAALPGGVAATVRPVSLPDVASAPVASMSGILARFDRLAFESLTAFLAVRLTAEAEGREAAADFVLNLPLSGAPADRDKRLLLAMLSNRERLLRYLLMLLADEPEGFDPGAGTGARFRWGMGSSWSEAGLPLLEPLLRALATDPARLDDLERLVRDLESTEEGRRLLPDDFVALWSSVRAVLATVRAAQPGGTDAAR